MSADADAALAALATEQANPATRDLDRMSPLEIVQAMNAEDARVAGAVATELPQIARAVEEIAARLRRGGRLIYVGAGTSGRLGVLDAAECPPTFSTPPDLVVGVIAGGPTAITRSVEEVEDRADAGRAEIERLDVTERDAVTGLAASGRTPYVLGAVAEARARGAFVAGVACTHPSRLAEAVDLIVAPIVGPEVVTGSARMKAGTAQKLVLNTLSTTVMIRLGKTFGNLLSEMQTTNEKLRGRASRIVAAAAGVDAAQGRRLLEAADGEIKTAILMGWTGLDPAAARSQIQAAGGNLRRALADH